MAVFALQEQASMCNGCNILQVSPVCFVRVFKHLSVIEWTDWFVADAKHSLIDYTNI